jgi:hypothetical protein
MVHKRDAKWEELPFESLEEAATFAGEMAEVINEAEPTPAWEVTVGLEYEHGKSDHLTPDELMETAQEEKLAPITEAETIFISAGLVTDPDTASYPANETRFGATVYITKDPWRTRTRLTVEGRKLTAVEGVMAATESKIAQYVEAKHRQEELRKAVPDSEPEPLPQPAWRRFVYNPWTITIGGGLVVVAVAALIASN